MWGPLGTECPAFVGCGLDLIVSSSPAGAAFSYDCTTVAFLPKSQHDDNNYRLLYDFKSKRHLFKTGSAKPLLGGCFCHWQREIVGGNVHDVNVYQNSEWKQCVSGKTLLFQFDGVEKSFPLSGVADKAFGTLLTDMILLMRNFYSLSS
jgi:hypothetical protein